MTFASTGEILSWLSNQSSSKVTRKNSHVEVEETPNIDHFGQLATDQTINQLRLSLKRLSKKKNHEAPSATTWSMNNKFGVMMELDWMSDGGNHIIISISKLLSISWTLPYRHFP